MFGPVKYETEYLDRQTFSISEKHVSPIFRTSHPQERCFYQSLLWEP